MKGNKEGMITLQINTALSDTQRQELSEKLIKKFSYNVSFYGKIVRLDAVWGPLVTLDSEQWEIDSVYDEPGEDGQRIWYLETWYQEFTEYCNQLIADGQITAWKWKNVPRVTHDNKEYEAEMTISSASWQQGIECMYAHPVRGPWYVQPEKQPIEV